MCKLSGTEAFDEGSGEYVSAELTLKYSFDAIQEGSKKATLRGEIALALKKAVTRDLTENNK